MIIWNESIGRYVAGFTDKDRSDPPGVRHETLEAEFRLALLNELVDISHALNRIAATNIATAPTAPAPPDPVEAATAKEMAMKHKDCVVNETNSYCMSHKEKLPSEVLAAWNALWDEHMEVVSAAKGETTP